MLRFFNFIFFILTFFSSCSIISFATFDISTNIQGRDYFEEDFIIIEFSQKLKNCSPEEYVTLKKSDYVTEIECKKISDKYYIKPVEGWIKNQNYKLLISGTFITESDGSFDSSYSKNFIYGNIDDCFEIISLKLPDNDSDNSIIVEFNKPIDINSFENNFSISPYISNEKVFSNNNKTVSIKPVSKFSSNTTYCCKFTNLISEDRTILSNQIEKYFTPIKCYDMPELLSIDVVKINSLYDKDYTITASQITDDQIKNISISDSIGFNFSKQVDLNSCKSGITFSPSVSGTFFQDNTRIIFIPDNDFKINQKYTITISTSIKDTTEIPLTEKKVFCFTPINDYLQISSFSINNNLSLPLYKALTNSTPIPEIDISSVGKAFISVTFSDSLSLESLQNLERHISFQAYFPNYIKTPVITNIQLSPDKKTVLYEFENISVPKNPESKESVENQKCEKYLYKLSIRSDKNYLHNSENEYLKEDLCTIIQVK